MFYIMLFIIYVPDYRIFIQYSIFLDIKDMAYSFCILFVFSHWLYSCILPLVVFLYSPTICILVFAHYLYSCILSLVVFLYSPTSCILVFSH